MAYQDLITGTTKFGNLYSTINANFAAVITNFAATSFPAAPMTYQICVRTDLLRMYYYDGDSWEDITDLFPDFQAVLSEVTAARGSAASLNARLSVAMNPDGTLIAGAPAGGWWSIEGGTVARVDGTSFTVTGDKTAIYKQGRAVFLDQTTDAYGYVAADSTYAGSPDLTTVIIAGATVDAGLSSVQYGQQTNNAPQNSMLLGMDFYLDKSARLIEAHASDKLKITVNKGEYTVPLKIGNYLHLMTESVHVDAEDDLDTGSLAAGTDYFVYACTDGTTLSFKVSTASTYPAGFDADHSRKIGGFHTLCTAVGTISGHTLSGYAQKDILPQSIWDLKHRARCGNNAGMVYDPKTGIWVDIYLASGTGASTLSVNGGTISDTRNWMDYVDDGGAVGKRLLDDTEFQLAASGSNEETNIFGSTDPVTTGGHSDTASRRMISNIGCEDMCGVVWQWLKDQSYYYFGSGAYWGNLPGGKGSVYTQYAADPGAPEMDNSDSGGDIKLLAGGAWSNAAISGSRSRHAADYRWDTVSAYGARFASEPL